MANWVIHPRDMTLAENDAPIATQCDAVGKVVVMETSETRLQPLPDFRTLGVGLFLLSAATLLFEINLTRLFSIAQFYHFAFMIVSIALLGYGASGTALSVFPALGKRHPGHSLRFLSLAAGSCMLGSYLLTNWLPFDSFSIAWDPRQTGILVLYYLALAAPFFFSGMATGLLLSAFSKSAGPVYAVNLLGSSAGCLAALAAPAFLGGEGTVTLSAGLAALAALAAGPSVGGRLPENGNRMIRRSGPRAVFLFIAILILALFAFSDIASRLWGPGGFRFLDVHLSPYKSLSYAMQQPGAEIVYRRWNAFSRVDLVRSPGIHSLPGLSYRYLQPLPPQDGLLIDGDDLSPVVRLAGDAGFIDYLPAAPAFTLRPQADVLVLEPRGGLDVLTALSLGARRVTAVEVNPLVVDAAGDIYSDPRVETVLESGRSFVRRTPRRFDLVLLSLASSYHPVRSGAYSLAEDYRYTVESFQDVLSRLNPGGLLVTTRWLQYPPSEELRTFALAVTALENLGGDPAAQIAAWRGYNTATILVKESAFTREELRILREYTANLAFDLIYAPDIREEETNRFNILPESIYYRTFKELLDSRPREGFYEAYPYDVSPPTDDHPFFGHFFKWSQAGQVVAEFGKVWQPFGGAGYFVILALLILAVLLAAVLIVLPLIMRRKASRAPAAESCAVRSPSKTVRRFFYFGLLGFGFLLVEIPLIQRSILFLDQPAYAMTAVLFSLLVFSGAGSLCSRRLPLPRVLALLAVLLFLAPLLLPPLFSAALGLPFLLRLGLAVLVLAPMGFLMGIPFPGGIRWVLSEDEGTQPIPWIWTVNGAASVVASVMAALLMLSLGFTWVFTLGALCYAGAWLIVALTGFRLPRLRR